MKRNSTELKVKYHGDKDKPTRKKNPNVADISKQGYRDDSPYRSMSSIDIHTPDGSIDMSGTGIPLWANGRILPPYSGIHQFDTTQVKEIPLAKTGGWLKKYQTAGNVLYVTDPKDPRLKAYRDSSMMYDLSKKHKAIFYKDPYDERLMPYNIKAAELVKKTKIKPFNYIQGSSFGYSNISPSNPDLEFYLMGEEPIMAEFKKPKRPVKLVKPGEEPSAAPVQNSTRPKLEPIQFAPMREFTFPSAEMQPAANSYPIRPMSSASDEEDIMMPSGQRVSKKEFIKKYGQPAWDRATNQGRYKKQGGSLPKHQVPPGQTGFIGPEEEQKPGVTRVMGTDQEGTPVLRPTTGYYLPEVEVTADRPDTYNNYMINKYKDAGLASVMFGMPLDYAFGYPQAAMTKYFSGKYQLPSEAMDIKNPIGAFVTDAVLDPANAVGAGIISKEEGLAGLLRNSAEHIDPTGLGIKNPTVATSSFLPSFEDLKGFFAKKPVEKVPANQAAQVIFTPPTGTPKLDPEKFYIEYERRLKGLRTRGKALDNMLKESNITGKDILHPDAIKYHGTYSGRPIVEVKMPDLSSEYFYKSTGWGGKEGVSPGQWQVYGEHMNNPHLTSSNWFVKGEDYADFYGSKGFGEIANNLDEVLSKKLGVSLPELNKKIYFKSGTTFEPRSLDFEKTGGSKLPSHLPEAYRSGGSMKNKWLDKYQTKGNKTTTPAPTYEVKTNTSGKVFVIETNPSTGKKRIITDPSFVVPGTNRDIASLNFNRALNLNMNAQSAAPRSSTQVVVPNKPKYRPATNLEVMQTQGEGLIPTGKGQWLYNENAPMPARMKAIQEAAKKQEQSTIYDTDKQVNPNDMWMVGATGYTGNDPALIGNIIDYNKGIQAIGGMGAAAAPAATTLLTALSMPATVGGVTYTGATIGNLIGSGFMANAIMNSPEVAETVTDPNVPMGEKISAVTETVLPFVGMGLFKGNKFLDPLWKYHGELNKLPLLDYDLFNFNAASKPFAETMAAHEKAMRDIADNQSLLKRAEKVAVASPTTAEFDYAKPSKLRTLSTPEEVAEWEKRKVDYLSKLNSFFENDPAMYNDPALKAEFDRLYGHLKPEEVYIEPGAAGRDYVITYTGDKLEIGPEDLQINPITGGKVNMPNFFSVEDFINPAQATPKYKLLQDIEDINQLKEEIPVPYQRYLNVKNQTDWVNKTLDTNPRNVLMEMRGTDAMIPEIKNLSLDEIKALPDDVIKEYAAKYKNSFNKDNEEFLKKQLELDANRPFEKGFFDINPNKKGGSIKSRKWANKYK